MALRRPTGSCWDRASAPAGTSGTTSDLDYGPPRLVDGFANGWLVTPGDTGTSSFSLVWEPQRLVWMGLGASLMAALVCLLVAVRGAWRPRDR